MSDKWTPPPQPWSPLKVALGRLAVIAYLLVCWAGISWAIAACL